MSWEIDTVFLDRDGTINVWAGAHDWVKDWSEFRFLPGAAAAVARLKRAGFRLVLVTNQRAVALGRMTLEDLEDIHRRMAAEIGVDLDGVYYCPHDKGTCDCRKPDVGLFRRAKDDMPEIDFARSAMVGDSDFDMEAGRRLGMRLVLISADDPGGVDLVVPSLEAATEEILRRTGRVEPGPDSEPSSESADSGRS